MSDQNEKIHRQFSDKFTLSSFFRDLNSIRSAAQLSCTGRLLTVKLTVGDAGTKTARPLKYDQLRVK